MADGAVTAALTLIEKVLRRMDQQASLYATLQTEVKAIQKWLERMQDYLAWIEKGRDVRYGVQTVRVSQVREVAHHIEDVIDELMFCVPHRYHKSKVSEKAHNFTQAAKVWHPLSSIQGMKEKIINVRKEIDDIITIDKLCEISAISEEASSSRFSIGRHGAPYAFDDCEMVGFVRQRDDIINWLTEARAATSSRNMVSTISVVGPGGSGKTTLVKNVFQCCKKEGLFDCYALVRVSQSFKLDELLQSILFQFSEIPEELVVPAQVTHVKLGHYIQQRKYLLVLDDLWSNEDWVRIMEKIPRHLGIYGSRIIVTTRNYEVASLCAQPHRYVVNLDGGLQDTEAQYLFCMHAFPTNDGFLCPPELSKWLPKFVERCDRLPSAIVDIGTLLSRKQHSNQLLEWEKIYDSLIKSDLSLASNVLLHSYKDLPCLLRSCLLYFSAFPRDYSIERGRLIRLWIAEGFVPEHRNRSLEEVAEGYLSELIGRNLVHVSRWDFDERARYCRVRNHVYDFVVHKSAEVNFITVFSERISDSSSSKKPRRLSLQGDCSRRDQSDLSLVRSALFFKRAIASSSVIRDILHAFKLLRVLDLRDAPLTDFPEEVITLVLLRYLSLRNTKVKKLPNSIKRLSLLETLDLKRTDVSHLPEGVLQLRNLRHLLVYRCNTGSHVDWDLVEGVELCEGIGLLDSLQKLLLVKPMRNQNVLKELKNLVRLRKLGIIGLKEQGGKDLCTSIEKMRNLSTLDISSSSKDEVLDLNYTISPPPHLQRLYLNGPLWKLHSWILSLTSLLKLTLKWSRLKCDTFEALQWLPNLIELEMVAAFDGDALVFKAGILKKLKILHIERFDQLKFVEIEEGSVFELQKLTLSSCVNLEMLPLGIYTLASLKQLLLYGMPGEFINRLERNSEDREMISGIPVVNVFVPGPDKSWLLERNIA